MFHPTPREAQMIEAIAEALISTSKAIKDAHGDVGLFVQGDVLIGNLRSLARGGGEEITFSPAQVEAIEKLMPRFFNTHLGPKGQFQETKKLYEYLDSHTESET